MNSEGVRLLPSPGLH